MGIYRSGNHRLRDCCDYCGVEMSESSMNLFQRINKVRKEVAYIQKDKSVSTGGGSYKAVTHDMVTAQTRAALVKHGVISWPNLVASSMIPPAEGAKQWRYEATYDFTFANVDDMTQTINIRIEAHAMDNADKAPGKALSYAKKYALLKLLDIETGEDEESRVPDESKPRPEDAYILRISEAGNIDEVRNIRTEAMEAFKAQGNAQAFAQVDAAAKSKRTQLEKVA